MLAKVFNKSPDGRSTIFGYPAPAVFAVSGAVVAAVATTALIVKVSKARKSVQDTNPLKSEILEVTDPKTGKKTITVRNWFGNVKFSPLEIIYPQSRNELLQIVRAAVQNGQRVRAVGSLHSWSESHESEGAVCVCTNRMRKVLEIDAVNKRVTFETGITYKQIFEALDSHNLALPVIPNHETLTFGGALANSAHGTHKDFGTMCSMVLELEIIVSRNGGEVLKLRRDAPKGSEELNFFEAAVGSIGNAGIVYSVTIQAIEKYHCITYTTIVPNEKAFKDPRGIAVQHDSALLFLSPFYPSSIAKFQFRISPLVSKAVKRPWLHDISLDYVLYHFKPGGKRLIKAAIGYIVAGVYYRLMGPTFFSTCYVMSWLDGETLKSWKDRSLLNMEYAIPVERINETVAEIMKLYETFLVRGYKRRAGIGLRAVAGDDLGFMSPTKGRPTVYVDMPYQQMDELELDFFKEAEKIFLSKDGRASWSRRFSSTGPEVLKNYPEAEKYMRAIEKLDPSGTFINAFQTRIFGHLDRRVRSR
eukprot:TRINITY_DN2915_c0_g1_i2.p1 TRINITY_DN2915_c0_g1~~TRINITY_DN2915_c0_g1_i2.p1  ORF type:complete len:531 (-),score=134.65 TRINITY_DN2915_c0_g1_i2:63-1655(-)